MGSHHVEVDGLLVEVGATSRGDGHPFLLLPGVPPAVADALASDGLVITAEIGAQIDTEIGAPADTDADVRAEAYLGLLDVLAEYDVCLVGGPGDAAVVAEVLARNPSRVSAVALLDPPAVADAVPDAGPAARLRTSALPVLVLGVDAAGWADAIPRAEVVLDAAAEPARAVLDFGRTHAVSGR